MFWLFKRFPTISIKELMEKNLSQIDLIDVRTPDEYRAGHIPQARNVPLDRISTYQSPKKEVYVICQSGMRSKQAVATLTKKGYHAINVQGGMSQWNGKLKGGK